MFCLSGRKWGRGEGVRWGDSRKNVAPGKRGGRRIDQNPSPSNIHNYTKMRNKLSSNALRTTMFSNSIFRYLNRGIFMMNALCKCRSLQYYQTMDCYVLENIGKNCSTQILTSINNSATNIQNPNSELISIHQYRQFQSTGQYRATMSCTLFPLTRNLIQHLMKRTWWFRLDGLS